jgi:predicted kinase
VVNTQLKKQIKSMNKVLFIVRGLPGSGKSTLAKSLGSVHFEADMYFMEGNEYKFDITKIKKAHEWCQNQVEISMKNGNIGDSRIAVSNTFTQEWEMKPYVELAEKYGYTVFTIIVENRHGGVNTHNVPEETLNAMLNRFETKLI